MRNFKNYLSKGGIVLLFVFSFVFILGSSSQVRNFIFKTYANAQEPTINPNLPSPSNLNTTALDSTIRANWTAPSDPNNLISFQVLSAWDNNVLVGAKVLSKTAGVADANGLVPNHPYTIKVQSMNAVGELSSPALALTSTVRQQPMPNAVFFENFNGPHGNFDLTTNLLSNYFDVRSDETVSGPDSINIDKRFAFDNENHFHTQLMGSDGHADLYIRPRVPMDISDGQVHTFQFEVDMPPVQKQHGKWFTMAFVQNVPTSVEDFGDNLDDEWNNSVAFTIRGGSDQLLAQGRNFPAININTNNVGQEFEGNTPLYTGTNVRVPVLLKVSTTKAEMWVNGNKVMEKTGFNLPFTKGYWILGHRSYYSARWFNNFDRPPVMNVQLIHWDTIQYDGVPFAGTSAKPYVTKTYVETGCPGTVNMQHNFIQDCPQHNLGSFTTNFSTEEDVTKIVSAKLVFNGGNGNTINVNFNGHTTTVGNTGDLMHINFKDIDPTWFRQGTNTLTLSSSGASVAQVEMEVIYDIPRQYVDPPAMGMPMLSVTSNNYTVDHINSDPTVVNLSTNLYSLGTADSLTYNAQVITDTPWLTITSPTTGNLVSPAVGGGVTPLTFQVNYQGLVTDDGDGKMGVIKVTGGTMPAYVAVLARDFGAGPKPTYIASTAFTPQMTTFNRDSVPCYLGCSGSPTPTPNTTIAPSVSPTPTRTPTPVPPTPTRTPTPGGPTPTLPPGGSLTVTFSEPGHPANNSPLRGEYPTGMINWGTSNPKFLHSPPWQLFTTDSISYNGAGVKSGTFTVMNNRKFVSFKAYNGASSGSTTITVSCLGQATKSVTLRAGAITTVTTGWTAPCASVTLKSGNGWSTNYDDFLLQ